MNLGDVFWQKYSQNIWSRLFVIKLKLTSVVLLAEIGVDFEHFHNKLSYIYD